MQKKTIYLDNAATTPLDPKVLKAMTPYLKSDYGNPSSLHAKGQKAVAAINEARKEIADFLGAQDKEIIFTGSATEANNLAVLGLARKIRKEKPDFVPHIITSQIEHDAILEPCKILEAEGIEITRLPVDKEGIVAINDVERAIKPNTILVSIMYANNEVGTIEPIREIGELLKKKKYQLQGTSYKIPFFHTDAVQAINYLDCNIERLGVDMLTLSGHKIYGPKGVGALYVKKGTPLEPIVFGGGQGFGLRSGTENVAFIAGLGAAIKEVEKNKPKIYC